MIVLVTIVVTASACWLSRGFSDEERGEVTVFIPDNPRFAAYVLRIQPNDKLVRIKRSEPVYLALLGRHGIEQKYRREALAALAASRKTAPLQQLLEVIAQLDQDGITVNPTEEGTPDPTEEQLAEVMRQLGELVWEAPPAELAASRDKLMQLATDAQHAASRQVGYAGLLRADAGVEAAWKSAEEREQLVDLLGAVTLLPDQNLRRAVYPRLQPLLAEGTPDPVRVAAVRAVVDIPGHEAETFALLAPLASHDALRAAVLDALGRLPPASWPRTEVPVLADALVAWLESLPAAERTGATGQEAARLAERLASVLPAAEAQRVRDRLAALAVRVITVKTVLEEMRYDTPVMVVRAGSLLEIVLVNEDNTPHNLVVTVPGSLEDVGVAAELMATAPGAAERHYVPDINQVLFATKMLEPRQSERLSFTVPGTPGVYPCVCTFPGHWRRMYAALVVVENVDDYLARNDPLPAAEDLLGAPKVVQEWVLDDLAPHLAQLGAQRSFENGARLFQRSSCSSCHRMQGQGGNIGPELTEVQKKYKPHEVLQEIIEPSLRLEEKYAGVVIQTEAGKVVRGVVVLENDAEVHLKENPLVDCETVVVRKDEIAERIASRTSPMPAGLLNTLHPEEILDLLAYVLAGGQPDRPPYLQK